MTRVFNFSPGPATLPESVLRKAAEEMLDWHGSGMSVMEMSHRGKEFISIHAEAESLVRELMGVPSNYKVLFMQGGAIGENVPGHGLGLNIARELVRIHGGDLRLARSEGGWTEFEVHFRVARQTAVTATELA